MLVCDSTAALTTVLVLVLFITGHLEIWHLYIINAVSGLMNTIPVSYTHLLFMENQGRVFTRGQLLDLIWNYDYMGDDKIINTHIKNIRKKLGVDCIETIRGVGYRIDKKN